MIRSAKALPGLLALVWACAAAGEGALPPIPRQGVWEITPGRLVQQVLAHNADALYARLQTEVAAHLLASESSVDEPVAFAALKHEDRQRQRTAQERTSSLFTSQNELIERVDTLEMGVRRRLLSGGEVSLSYRFTDRRNNIIHASSGAPDDEYDGALTLTLKHPLLRGAGDAAQTDRVVAELELGVARQQYRQQILKAASEALGAYWQLYKAHELAQIRRETLEQARRALADAEVQLAAGRANRAAAREVRALAGLREVETLRAEQGLLEAESRVKSLLNLPVPEVTGLRLKPVQAADADADAPPWDEARLQAALEVWPPWRVSQLRREQGRARLDYARNQTRPALDVVASCASTRLAYDSDQVIQHAASRLYPDCYLGLNLELPLRGNRRADGQFQAQTSRVAQADLELDAVRAALFNEIWNRRQQLEGALEEVRQLRRDLALRLELLEAERTQMSLGFSRLAQVIERENAVQDSRARLLESKARVEQARVALRLASGELLPGLGVELVE